MRKIYTLRLDSNDIGQILDGLRCRADSWRETAGYLESVHATRDDFIAEECSNADEARSIASIYERIIREIEMQLQPPARRRRKHQTSQQMSPQLRSGYCVFINAFFQGTTVSVFDGENWPVVFPTKREAQLEIVDFHMIRLNEFIDGDRDYEDALEVEEYVSLSPSFPMAPWSMNRDANTGKTSNRHTS